MRVVRTEGEEKIRKTILPFVSELVKQPCIIDESVVDRPDIVVITENNEKLGVEVTRLAYEKFMKWLSKGTPIGKKREAKVIVNLDRQIEAVLKQKNRKYLEYKRARKLKEVWLCLHNDLYEFNTENSGRQLDPKWFFNEAWLSCRKHECKFDRVLFFSENSKQYLSVYEKRDRTYRPSLSISLPVISFVEMVGKVGMANDCNLVFDIATYPVDDKKTFGEA